MDKWGQLAWEARRQLGVVHVRQAEALGISRQTLARRAGRSGWRRLHPGVYLLPGVVPDYRARISAALLAVGDGSAAARTTAAALWKLVEGEPELIEIVVPHESALRSLHGVKVIRSRTLEPRDLTRIGPLAVTRIDRTLCDLAGVLPQAELREAVARAGQRSLDWPRRAAARAAVLPALPGRVALLEAVRDVLGEGRTDSVQERRTRRLLRAEGFRPVPGVYPVVHKDRLIAMVDIAFPEHRVAIEVDGFAFHATPAQLRADHARQNRLEAAGWTVLRVGAQDLADGSPGLVRALCELGVPGGGSRPRSAAP